MQILTILIAITALTFTNASPLPNCSLRCNTDLVDEVCGSDSVTYKNACLLATASCSNPSITELHKGRCDSSAPEPTGPGCAVRCNTQLVKEVCGTDGITYQNSCLLLTASCGNPTLKVASTGRCVAPLAEPTGPGCGVRCDTRLVDEVCGSDGVTYKNPCLLLTSSCGNPSLKAASKGACPVPPTGPGCAVRCNTEIVDEVCGTDGLTYKNPCLLLTASCGKPDLTQAKKGKC
ncbi:hypothetical protein HDU67_009548 [Dinochytrium kinnereticum]|nr:hypothetical protein HDU67_009548 [Dinochytrium kinnereticum]